MSSIIPDTDNVVRYLGGTKIDGEIVLGEGFRLPAENPTRDRLSINWLDYFEGLSKDEQVSEVRRLSTLKVGPKGRWVELNVGKTREHLRAELDALRFVSSPTCKDPSHGDIVGLPGAESPMASLVGDMIAQCVQGLHLAIPTS